MKQKIDIICFTRFDKINKDIGTLSIEIRPQGKWLTYKKGNTVKRMKLTKKSYKNLKRFSSGIVATSYIEIEEPVTEQRNPYDMEGYDSCDDGDGLCMGDDNYCIFSGKKETIKQKEKALFVVQVFKWQPIKIH